MKTALRIALAGKPLLEIDPDDMVFVPMDPGDRALCREALEDALLLLAQTVVTHQSLAQGRPDPDDGVIFMDTTGPRLKLVDPCPT